MVVSFASAAVYATPIYGTVSHTVKEKFKVLGTVSGKPGGTMASSGDTEAVSIMSLPTWDPAVGKLRQVEILVSMDGYYNIQSRCRGVACSFNSRFVFGDSYDIAPPGAGTPFRLTHEHGNPIDTHTLGYSSDTFEGAVTMTSGNCNFECTKSKRGYMEFIGQYIVRDPLDLEQFLLAELSPGKWRTHVDFLKEGTTGAPDVGVVHQAAFQNADAVIDVCLSECNEGLFALSLAAYIARQNHILYNETHFLFEGSREAKVIYLYESHESSEPVPLPSTITLLALGLLLLQRRVR